MVGSGGFRDSLGFRETVLKPRVFYHINTFRVHSLFETVVLSSGSGEHPEKFRVGADSFFIAQPAVRRVFSRRRRSAPRHSLRQASGLSQSKISWIILTINF